MLVAALALGTMSAFAQDEVEEVTIDATEIVDEATEEATEAIEEATEVTEEATEAIAEEAVEAVEETEAIEAVEAVEEAEAVMTQDGFNEIAIEELPEAITTALEAAHPGATVSKAYMNDASQYKLEVAKEDGASVELYADAEGNWIEM